MNGMGKNSAKIHNVKWYSMLQFTTLICWKNTIPQIINVKSRMEHNVPKRKFY